MNLIRFKAAVPKPKPERAPSVQSSCFYCSMVIHAAEEFKVLDGKTHHKACGNFVLDKARDPLKPKPDFYIADFCRYAGAHKQSRIHSTQEPFHVYSEALDVYVQAKNEWDWVRLIRRGHSDLYAVQMGKK